MSGQTFRGYGLAKSFEFLESHFGPQIGARVIEGLPHELRALKGNVKPAEWYPRSHLVNMFRGIASVKNDEKGSYDDVAACGEFIANEASNTFLKLVMKILTPTMFAKKFPDFWNRDQRGGGRFELLAVDDAHIHLRLTDVKDFDHIGAATTGWVKFGLGAMGKSNILVKQTGWSLQAPGPESIDYNITWS